MVRLETTLEYNLEESKRQFTFQYGQIRNFKRYHDLLTLALIYIPVWLDQKQYHYDIK